MLKLKQLSKEQQRGRESECASKRVREEAKSQAINCSEGSICSTQLVKQANDWVHERRERDFHFTLSFLSLVAGRSMHYGRRTQAALRRERERERRRRLQQQQFKSHWTAAAVEEDWGMRQSRDVGKEERKWIGMRKQGGQQRRMREGMKEANCVLKPV